MISTEARPAPDEPREHRWTRAEFQRLGELELFADRRVELVEGIVYEMAPMKRPHWTATQLTTDALRELFGPGYFVTSGLPLYLTEDSEPQPDVAVFRGAPRDYTGTDPVAPLLVVEVSDTSLKHDRTVKDALYARAGIPEYWILNLPERVLEIRSAPEPVETGAAYSELRILGAEESASPLALGNRRAVTVGQLLP